MQILSTIFFIFVGLLYLGISFPYQEILIGISALVIGIMKLVGMFRR